MTYQFPKFVTDNPLLFTILFFVLLVFMLMFMFFHISVSVNLKKYKKLAMSTSGLRDINMGRPLRKFSEYKRSAKAQYALRIGKVPVAKKLQALHGKVTNIAGAQHLIKVQSLPANFDWRSVTSHPLYPKLQAGNYCSDVHNQHAPLAYCGSCWVFSSLQTMSDRIHIMNGVKTSNNFSPKVMLSAQQVIDCCPDVHCFTGGDSYMAYSYVMNNNGISDDTCKQYLAIAQRDRCDPECYTCMAESQNKCSDIGQTTFTSFGNKRCCKVDSFTKYQLEGFSNVNARFNDEVSKGSNGWKSVDLIAYIQTEIYRFGPLTIAIDATDDLELFPGGSIFVKRRSSSYTPTLNHLVAVVGWGTDPKTGLYWIIRNSWGTFWCEGGYFKADSKSIGLDDPNNDFFAPYPQGYANVLGVDVSDEGTKVEQT